MRGRRVALLLTGLWPLLAKDDVPVTKDSNVTISANDEDDEHDVEALQHLKPPVNELASMIMTKSAVTSNPSNVVMADMALDEHLVDETSAGPAIIRTHPQHVENEKRPSEESSVISEETDPIPEVKETEQVPESESPGTANADASEESNEERVESVMENATSESETALDDTDETEKRVALNGTTDEESGVSESTDTLSDEKVPMQQDTNEDEDEDDATDRVLVDYASKSAGALILEKSPAMKGTSNLLNADNDKYAIAPCSEKKFVVIGLSEDILVKQVKLANYERYSSHLKDFQLMGSQTMGEWVDLGTYTAEPGNDEQAFDLDEPSWARYLKFRFLSHHGSEHYCTYSQIKVHGSTMLQGFHEQWDSQDDLEQDLDGSGGPASVTDTESVECAESREVVANDDSSAGDTGTNVGEVSAEAESPSVQQEQSLRDETGRDVHEGPSGIDSEDGSKKTTDVTNGNDSRRGVATHDSEQGTRAIVDEGSETKDQGTDDTVTVDENPPSSVSSEVDSVAGAKQGSDEMNSSVSVNQESPSALSCASIGTTSHDAVNADCTGSIEQLDTSAIKPTDSTIRAVVSTVVESLVNAEATKSLMDAESVSDEVKEIQEKLKTIGTGTPKLPEETEVRSVDFSTSEAVEAVAVDHFENATVSTNHSSEDENENATGDNSEIVESGALSDERIPYGTIDAESTQEQEIECTEPTSERHKNGEEVGSLDMDLAILKIVERFPTAACLKGLDFQDFKAKLIAARKDRANAQGGHPSGNAGKMEPIFKTLTDEIKGLQMSQSVQDQYMRTLVSCYQQVMLEMAGTLTDLEAQQEQRLLDLERAVDAMRANKLTKLLAFVVATKSACFLGAKSFSEAMAASRARVLASGRIDETALDVVLGVCALGFLAILCYLLAARQKDFEQRRRRQGTLKNSERMEASVMLEKQKHVGDKMPTASFKSSTSPDAEQSESGSESSDVCTIRAATVLSNHKRSNNRTEPTLVPLE